MKFYNSQNQFGQRFITAQDYDIHFRGNITLSPNTFLSDGSTLTVVLDNKADKTSLDNLTIQVENLNEVKADKSSLDNLNTQVQLLNEQKADKSALQELQNDLTYELSIEPSAGALGNANYKYAKINGIMFPTEGTLKSVSIMSRSSGARVSDFYIMVFQQQQDSTSTDASTWEFKGISNNAPSQAALGTYYEYTFDDLKLLANKHVAFLLTKNPEQTTWVVPSDLFCSRTQARLTTDTISVIYGTGGEVAHLPVFKYVLAQKTTNELREICIHGGAITKDSLASSMDDNDKLPTAQMVKDYVDSLISNQ